MTTPAPEIQRTATESTSYPSLWANSPLFVEKVEPGDMLRKLKATKIVGPVSAGRIYAPCLVRRTDALEPAMPVMGFIDTGAHNSAIDCRLADYLRLPQVGTRRVTTPTGWSDEPTYMAAIEFFEVGFAPAAVAYEDGIALTGMVAAMAIAPLLIGMDVLGQGIRLTLGPAPHFEMDFS